MGGPTIDNATVQNGTAALASNIDNVTLGTAVNTSRSLILLSTRSTSDDGATLLVTGTFTDNSTLRFDRYSNSAATLEWEVVQNPDFTVQRGETYYNTTETTLTATISAVNLSNSFLVVYSRFNNTPTPSKFVWGLWTGNISNSTTLSFERGGTNTLSNGTLSWQVVSWSQATVQSGTAAASNTFTSVPITAVNLSTSFLVLSSRCTSAGGLNVMMVQGYFVNSTSISFLRGSGTGTATASYFVVSSPDVTVQRGNYAYGASAAVQSIPISTVNTSRTFTINSLDSEDSTNSNSRGFATIRLANSTAVEIQKDTASGTINNTWFAISFIPANLTADSVPPSIQFVTPTGNSSSYVSRRYIFANVTANDTNLANITILLYNSAGSLVNSSNTTSASLFVNFSVNADGVYYFNATVYDSVNNFNKTETRNITVDTENPAIQFTTLTDNSSSYAGRNYVNINVTANDTNLANITILLYNSAGSLVNSSNTTSASLFANFSVNADGVYYFNATVYDSANNLNKTETRNITVDTENPAIQFTTPTDNSSAVLGRRYVEANASASDLTLANITVYLYNSTGGIINSSFTASSSIFANFSVNNDGNYSFKATAMNLIGLANSTETRNITVDTENPAIQFVTPTDNSSAVLGRRYVEANVSASDLTLANITIYLYNSTGGLVNFSFTASSSIFANFSVNNDGNYSFSATAYDYLGRYNSTETRNVTVNTQYPGVEFTTPTDNSSAVLGRRYVEANVSASDLTLANITVYLYNSTGGLVNSSFTASSSIFANFSVNNDGNYSFKATAMNLIGLANTTETRNVTIDTANPAIHFTTPTDNSSTLLGRRYVEVNVSASDLTLANITIYLYNSTGGLVNSSFTASSSIFANFSVNEDGNYSFSATAYDYLGRYNSTETRNVTVNTQYPGVEFTTPTDNSSAVLGRRYVETNVSASDLTLANITIYLYNSTGGLINSSFTTSASLFANFSVNNDGNYSFKATAMNLIGLANTTETRNVTIDTANPAIQFVSPTDNSSTIIGRKYVEANVSASDLTLANITVYLYNSTGGLVNSSFFASSSIFANFSVNNDGNYSFSATAYDYLGRYNSTETRNVTIDTTNPEIQFITPTDNSSTVLGRKYIQANVSASDILLTNITVYLYNSTGGLVNSSFTNTSSSIFANFSVNNDGNYSFKATAMNLIGLANTTETRNVTIDTTNPAIHFTTPTDNSSAVLGRRYVEANASASDLTLANITIYLYDSAGALINSSDTASDSLFANFSVNADGTYYFNATAYDTAGHANSTATWNVAIDTAPPTVEIQSPDNITIYTTANIGLNYTVSDAHLDSCAYMIDGGAPIGLANCANVSALAGITSGNHTVMVIANDTLGNTATAEVNFTANLTFEANAPVYSGLMPGANYSETYRPGLAYLLNATWTDGTGIGAVLVENNFSGSWSNSSYTGQAGNQFEYDTGSLGAGTYAYRWIANDTWGNMNDTMPYRNITVLAADPGVALAVSPSWSGTWPYGTSVNCTGAAQVNMSLYRNGTLAASGMGFASDAQSLTAGAYFYVCNTSGNGNYTDGSASSTLTISKLISALALSASPAWSVNWSTAANVSCNASPALNISLYREDALVGSALGYVEDVSSHAAGAYSYVCNISGSENYTADSASGTLTVSQTPANISLLLNGAASSVQLASGQTLAINGSVASPANGYIELYVDGALFNSGNGSLYNTTSWSSPGTHTIRLVFNATQNYSAINISRTATIPSSTTTPSPSTPEESEPALPSMSISNYTLCNSDGTGNVRVVVSSNGTALDEVSVYIDPGESHMAYASGYTFRSLASSTYAIYANKDGYDNASLTVAFNCVPAPGQNQTGGAQNGTTGGNMSMNQTSSVRYTRNGSVMNVNVTVSDVGADYAVYQVDSLPETITVHVGENRTVDVDGDGKPDIFIMLNSVLGNNAFAVFGAIGEAAAGQQGGNATNPGANVTNPANVTQNASGRQNVTACIADSMACRIGSDCCSGICNTSAGICAPAQPPKPFDWIPLLVALAAVALICGAAYYFLAKGAKPPRKFSKYG
jgi:hypothetical protein